MAKAIYPPEDKSAIFDFRRKCSITWSPIAWFKIFLARNCQGSRISLQIDNNRKRWGITDKEEIYQAIDKGWLVVNSPSSDASFPWMEKNVHLLLGRRLNVNNFSVGKEIERIIAICYLFRKSNYFNHKAFVIYRGNPRVPMEMSQL